MRPTSGSSSSACAPSAARAASRATACSCRKRSRSRRPSRRCWPSTPRRSRRPASRANPSARARSSCARCRGCSAGATLGRRCPPSPASWGVAPGEAFDAARFRDAARAAIADIARRGRAALVVGGTGLYVRALLRGLCPAPPRAPALRAALAAEDAPALHRRLGVLDPAAAARIAPTDARRIVRALEVALSSGVPLSRWQAEHGFGERAYDALVIGLARPTAELDARIAARARAMVDAGFLDEVRALHRRGLAAETPGLSAVGYRELLACVEGRTGLDTALAAIVRATRRFAKRQRTWFRREPALVWHHPEREAETIVAAIGAFLAGAAPAVRTPA